MDKTIIGDITGWISNYVENSGANGVVVGISGGKDSLICAKLCVLALSKERVFGVIMPNGEMKDIDDAKEQCKLLGINYVVTDIKKAYNAVVKASQMALVKNNAKLKKEAKINIAPRVRMTTLYAIAQSLNYLVVNTSNFSEAFVGYTTKWGDNVGDFSVLGNFTKNEVCKLGLLLELPPKYVKKQPNDGLSGKSDEEKLGFSYEELDTYIRENQKNTNHKKILKKHNNTMHKRNPIPTFNFQPEKYGIYYEKIEN